MKFVKIPHNILLLLLIFACSKNAPESSTINNTLNLTTPKVKTIELNILNQINDYRTSRGLKTLASNSLVKAVAKTHTDYMVETNQVNHHNFFQRSAYLKENESAITVSENVAYGYTSAASVVSAWLNSSVHLATIEGDYTHFDISAEQNSEGKWYYTNIYIKKDPGAQ